MKDVTGSDALHHTSDQWHSVAALFAATAAPAGREAVWGQALAFLEGGHRDDDHLVASVLVVDPGGLVILARHRRYRQWGPLGGHLESGDAGLCAAAARELFEETGLVAHVNPAPVDVRLSSFRCRTVADPILHLDAQFIALSTTNAPALISNDELTGLEWFGTGDMSSLTPAAAALVGRARTAAIWRR